MKWVSLGWPFVIYPPVTEINPGGPMIPATSSATSVQSDFVLFRGGNVDLTAYLRNGETHGSIEVYVHGYVPGIYTVSAVTVSSGSTFALGSLKVSKGIIPPVLSGSLHVVAYGVGSLVTSHASSPASIVLPLWGGHGKARFGGNAFPFPAGFSPFDVQSVSISDSNGNIVSTATLTPVPSGYLTALTPETSGSAAPNAAGRALLHATAAPLFLPMDLTATAKRTLNARVAVLNSENTNTTNDITNSGATLTVDTYAGGTLTLGSGDTTVTSGSLGVITSGSGVWGNPVPIVKPIAIDPLPIIFWHPQTGTLAVHGHGLPANTAVTIYADDGTILGTGTTSASGKLNFAAAQGGAGTLPTSEDLFSLQSITVQDSSGNVLLSANF